MPRIVSGGGAGALTLFGNPSADLDQCANDPAPSDPHDGCASSASDWVNGNLGASKAVYAEGYSIPYRMRFDNLDTSASNSHTVQIEWDTTKSGKHAIDYLTTWNRTVADSNPCIGVTGCTGSPATFAIPTDPQVSGAGVSQIAGSFAMWGGTITAVSAYTYPDGAGFAGDKSADIVITFTAATANPVLAWAGHIADHHDWGAGTSAVNIPGSPYHMRLINLDGSGGNQDRSLSAEAVIFPGTIRIVKSAVPTDATAAFGFTASPLLTPASFNLDGSNGGTTNVEQFNDIKTFGTYTFNEATIPSNWAFTSASCSVTNANGGSSSVNGTQAQVTLKEGEDWICTYTNTRATKLTLVKSVTNNNGGTAVASAWTLAASGDSNGFSGASGVSHAVTPGVAYALAESNGPSNYTLTGWSCSGGTQSGASITLASGDDVTCTATNNDNAPQLHLRKVVTNDDGGSAAATAWTLSATGPTSISGSTPVDSGASFSAGTYALAESGGPNGYTASSWSCTGGGSLNGANLTIGIGENVTCTITNDDNPPQLKLVKNVVNNDGGTAAAGDFTLAAAAATGSASRDFTSKSASPAFHNVFAGAAYNLSETAVAGYSSSGVWSCDSGSLNGAGNAITLSPGAQATCTLTNTDDTPQLKLVKVVDNTNGGSASAADFTLHADATSPTDRNFTSATATPDFHNVFAGVSYSLSETGGPSGYTSTGQWTCDGGTLNQAKNAVTVTLGQQVTCQLTNTSVAPQLKLVKNVVNNDGGSAGAADWTLSASATSPADRNFTSASASPAFHNVYAAASYALSEAGGPSGYASTGQWTCDGGTLNADKNAITLAPGAQVTCTITNDDAAAQLKLVKSVVNQNGGSAGSADFTLSAAASSGSAARDFTSASASPAFHDIFGNVSYNLSETSPSGYTSTGQWSCDGGTLNQAKNAVTVAVGAQATCTLINTDVAPQLKLVKNVVNDDGGSATAADWTLHAEATSPAGRNFTSASASPAFHTVFAGATYVLSETGGPSGYSSTGQWTCSGGTLNEAKTAVTLALGAQVTCTITNNDNAPQLKLVKNVVNDNGGTAGAGDWTLSAAAASPNGGRNFTSASATPAFHNVLAGTSYALSESAGPAGYSSTGQWTCTGGTLNDAKNAVTVAVGGQATCTITNDDVGPTITVQKRLVPTADAGTFDFSIAQSTTQTLTNGGQGYGNLGSTGAVTVNAGSATVAELGHGATSLTDYSSSWSCSNDKSGSGTSIALSGLALGQNVTCTFTNTRLATLIVKKVVDNSNGGGSRTAGDFTLHVTQGGLDIKGSPKPGSGSGTTYTGLLPGTYKVGEDAVAGYSLTSISGCLADGSIVLAAGQTATCTLTNTSAAPPPPPPPPPPAPRIDLSVTKAGSPSPQTVGKQITWTMVVTNNGPNNATGVTAADPIPAGTTFVSASSSQGTCTGGAILSCAIGNMAVGTSVTVTLITTANTTGTIPNTVTVVGNEAETNTSNNTASASVNVIGVFKPPAVVYCTAVSVAPKQLFAGKQNTLRIKVSQHGKASAGVRVRIKGASLSILTAPSNASGVVKRAVKPTKAGIITFVPVASKKCNAPRVGVIGVFTPPVTG